MSREHNIIVRPIITEKSTIVRGRDNQYIFEVSIYANKPEIKKAIEKLFNVKVDSVKTANYLGKIKRVRYKPGRRPSYKKAIIKLKEGNTLKIFEGK